MTVYIRTNDWYERENVVKMGISASVKDRENTYITGEFNRGHYISIIEIPPDKMRLLDKSLKLYFKPQHIYTDGGTEFYDKSIVEQLEPYFAKLKLEYKFLTAEEIASINRRERMQYIKHTIETLPNIKELRNIVNRLNIRKVKKIHDIKQTQITPNEHQREVLERIEDFFETNNSGKIVWACGLGKALLSVLIILKYQRTTRTVVYGVPSVYLQKQMKNEIVKIFTNPENILFVGGKDNTDEDDKEKDHNEYATNKTQISAFLTDPTSTPDPKFIISTYHSCHLLADNDFIFDFKIGDEAHHLVGAETEDTKGFRAFHKICSTKSLYMTATEKTTNQRYSMDDESVFGKYIDVKTVHWAIENSKITDYRILVLKNTENEVDAVMNSLRLTASVSDTNKDLFLSCYMCIKSFERYDDLTHILLYTNTVEEANSAKKYIDVISAFYFPTANLNLNLYNNSLHSKNCNDLKGEIEQFENTPRGIISCVYIFGEGVDLPKLNGVCIAGNMQSEIRIVQSLLRPNRLDRENPHKIAYVIIPYMDTEDWITTNKSFEKIRTISAHMRNMDSNVEQKIRVFDVSGTRRNKADAPEDEMGEEKDGMEREWDGEEKDSFIENEKELNKLKLRLRYSKSLTSNFSEEQDEYNYVSSINSSLSVQSKTEYDEKRNRHEHFIEFPEEYFKSKGVWKDWYDFMGVDTSKFIQSKEEWINFCKDKKVGSLEEYNRCCEIYDVLPKEPAEFYRYKGFTSIHVELGFYKKRR